jgi:uncharacterized protein
MMASFEALCSFLEDDRRPADALGYHELQGFLFALASAPEVVSPSEWLAEVFADDELEQVGVERAARVIDELMTQYNEINAVVADGRAALPADCSFRPELMANLAVDAPVSRWSRGFIRGHTWLEESWEAYLPEELDKEVGAMLMTLSFFASRDLAESFFKETGAPDLEDMAETMREVYPLAMAGYAELGLTIQRTILEAELQETPTREKTGRNDPCPCGSGRKYKKCCGGTVQ